MLSLILLQCGLLLAQQKRIQELNYASGRTKYYRIRNQSQSRAEEVREAKGLKRTIWGNQNSHMSSTFVQFYSDFSETSYHISARQQETKRCTRQFSLSVKRRGGCLHHVSTGIFESELTRCIGEKTLASNVLFKVKIIRACNRTSFRVEFPIAG